MSDREAAAARFRAALRSPPQVDPVRDTRRFLRTFVADAISEEEALRNVAGLASTNARAVVEGLTAMEALLADPPRDGTLSAIVAEDANIDLDDPGDAGAATWLAGLAASVREILGGHAPPPR